jgi:hypothetical protein
MGGLKVDEDEKLAVRPLGQAMLRSFAAALVSDGASPSTAACLAAIIAAARNALRTSN